MLRVDNKFTLTTEESTDLELYDHKIVKRQKIKDPRSYLQSNATGKNLSQNPEGKYLEPYKISVRDMLTDVNDNNENPFINEDGSGNYDFNEDTRSFTNIQSRIDYEAQKQYADIKKKYRKTNE